MTIYTDAIKILGALARLDGDRIDWEHIADAMRDATEDADDWLSAYGRAIYVGDEQIGTVDELPWSYDIAAADDDTARTILAAAIAEMAEDVLDEEDVRDVVDDLLAFLRDAKTIHGHLTEAADAVERGSVDGAIGALRLAEAAESEHGDTPSTSGVTTAIYESADDASEEARTAWRVYDAPPGSCMAFVGEYDDEDAAIAAADGDDQGLPESLWETARAAGHVMGYSAPLASGVEDEEPCYWAPDDDDHRHRCVVRVEYPLLTD